MHFSSARRFGFLALLALLFVAVASPSQAQTAGTGNVRLKIVKAGWFIGGQGGDGTLTFAGRTYRLGIGGLSAGLTFGGSATDLVGTARNLRSASDIAGIYTAVGAGVVVAGGARVIYMCNSNGVVLSLRGHQIGLAVDLDLSGMALSLK